jgi:hypothetical protein
MARKKSGGEGGGNAVLVIFLVLFILVSIGLGVAYWTGQETVAKAKKDGEDAVKKVNDEKDAKELAELKMKLYKAFIGTATEDEKAAIQSPGKHADALKEEHAALVAAATAGIKTSVTNVRTGQDGKVIEGAGTGPFNITEQDIFTWQWPAAGTDKVLAKQPSPGPMLDRMVKIAAERERMFHESNLAKKNADSAAAQYKAEKDNYTKALGDAKTQVDAQIKKLDDAITAVENEKKAAIDTFTKTGDDVRKDVAKKAREVEETKTVLVEERARLENLQRQIGDMLSRQKEQDEDRKGVFAVNVPHGEIVSRKPGSSSVEISIGSDAGLRPGQTFTVQPATARADGLTRQRKTSLDAEGRTVVSEELASKGSIEVVSVLGPRLSTARITDEPEKIRDGILKGDLLFNPLFRKNAKDHVVLVGIFDTNADGIDDIAEVARNLSKRGAIVDGYFDLGTGKWESLDPTNRKPGPGSNTTYVVRGWEWDGASGDPLTNAKAGLRDKLTAALTEAKTKGAQEVRAAKFLSEIGYSFSPSISDETVSAAAVKYLKGPAAAPDAPIPPK